MVYGGLVTKLQYIINQSPNHSDVDIIIARYLLNHLYQDQFSISDIANQGHISKASITRFAQNLGYEGFNDLKKDYDLTQIEREEMKIDLEAMDQKSSPSDSLEMLEQFKQLIEDLEIYRKHPNLEQIEELCAKIHESKQVYLFATLIPGNLAEILQHMLLTAGKYVEYYPQPTQQLEAAEKLGKGDLALFISLEGSYVMQKDLTLTITGSESTAVLITQNPSMKLSSLFDDIVVLGEHGQERSGKYKLLMFVELLAHYYFKNYV